MKASLALSLALLVLTATARAADDQTSVPKAKSSAAPAAATSNPSSAAPAAPQETGLIVKDGETYLIENHQARRIDEQRIPEGQMLNLKGQLVPLPAEVRGFDADEVSASAATTSAAAATTNPETTGITIRAGNLFHIRDGRATRFNPNTLGSTLMMTLDGRHVPLPENIEFIRSAQDNSAPGNPAKK